MSWQGSLCPPVRRMASPGCDPTAVPDPRRWRRRPPPRSRGSCRMAKPGCDPTAPPAPSPPASRRAPPPPPG
eukprot:2877099-Pyramimonas_sp.AAC.1